MAKKKLFRPSELFNIGHDFLSNSLYKGANNCFHNLDFIDIKSGRILRRFHKFLCR
jgi:hypothetical protein